MSMITTVTDLSRDGDGIARENNLELYIKDALPGEKLEVEVGEPFAPRSRRCPARVIRRLETSPERNPEPECSLHGQCGGCQLLHLSTKGQIKYRQQEIEQAVKAVCEQVKQPLPEIREIIPCTQRPCRFKSIRYAANDANDQIVFGFYAARSHELIPVTSCPLELQGFANAAAGIEQCCRQLHLKALSEEDAAAAPAVGAAAVPAEAAPDPAPVEPGTQVRALLLRACDEGSISATLIVTAALSAGQQESLRECAARLGLASMVIGINNRPGNALFTDDLTLIQGEPFLLKTIMGQTFEVRSNTFLQVNYEVCEQLYTAAVAHCAHNSQLPGLALDLCCGVGTMTLSLARHFKEVLGVEIVPESVQAAERNAERNQLSDRTRFMAAALSQVLPGLIKGHKIPAVIADPSRAGLGEVSARALSRIKGPCRLAVIFCALPALKRDLPVLLNGGFKIDYIQGFDMFPNTTHVETLVCLSRS